MVSLCFKHAGTRGFRTGHGARRALAAIRRFGAHTGLGKPCRVYRCKTCGRWFLTADPQ